MSEQHTQGKLRLERDPMHFDSMSSIRGGEHRMHLGLPDELMIEVGGWSPAQEANARRVKACWDLLVDVPTKEIEAAANYGASWGKTGLELAALTVKLEALKAENTRLRAELEAVGAGGVQPLRAEAGWALVPVEPTLEMLDAGTDGGAVWLNERTAATVYRLMLAAAPKAPQQAEPAPPQKPKLRVGQVWLTRGGATAKIVRETPNAPYPFLCVSAEGRWTVTKDGRFDSEDVDAPDDLIKLLSDVPQEGGEA